MFDIILRVVKIYYSDISGLSLNNKSLDSLPPLRRDYVNGFKHENRKKQSLFVWKLLEYLLKKEYGAISPFTVCENNGVWGVEGVEVNFSLAHSNEIVSVAFSENSVGVDVEQCSPKVLKLKNKFSVSSQGLSEIESLTLEWTRKESLFKAKRGKNYYYKKIADVIGNNYFLTACADDDCAQFFSINACELE